MVAGAAQLGVGYGLGIIGWRGDNAGWVAALAWTMWVGAFAVLVGSVAGHLAWQRIGSGDGGTVGRTLWKITISLAATIGAMVVVPLTALPAREVPTDATSAPGFVVAWYAVVGVLAGLVLSILALHGRAVTANLVASGAWWWLIAVIAVVDAVAGGRGLVPAQLGAWRFTSGGEETVRGTVEALEMPGEAWWDSIYLPGAVLMVIASLVIGMLAALPAARRGDGWIGVALSGAAGPGLLTAVFLLASPRLTSAPAEQLSALLIAPYAVLAGLLGSVAVTLVVDHAARPKPVVAPVSN